MTSVSHPGDDKPKDKNDKEHGCLKIDECQVGHPFVCQMKNPDCDQDTNRFKDYLIQVLTQATEANKVCTGSCKPGTGLAPFFEHKVPIIGSETIRKVKTGKTIKKKNTKKNKKNKKVKKVKKNKNNKKIKNENKKNTKTPASTGGLSGLSELFFG